MNRDVSCSSFDNALLKISRKKNFSRDCEIFLVRILRCFWKLCYIRNIMETIVSNMNLKT